MRVLFLFLDGVGLGSDDPAINPLARAEMPNLARLLDGRRLVADNVPLETPRASVVSLDACLGVAGMPQSASGQAALLTGLNVPALIGGHYGPWPSQAIVNLLANGSLFRAVQQMGGRAGFLNAYPPGYFAAIQAGRRLYSAIPRAAVSAGLTLKTLDDLRAGRALSADFTGRAWRERLGLADTPLLIPRSAGERMAALASEVDFTFFEYWLSDYAGHRQDMAAACTLLETVDAMVGGLTDAWDNDAGLILLTSDHGNMEDLGTRGHTTNPVPALLIGAREHRQRMVGTLHSLSDVAPGVMRVITGS
jgi:2,3-bisphosphoglycerate-independent phosphoglycerate mutase